jgi:hypothetical protein
MDNTASIALRFNQQPFMTHGIAASTELLAAAGFCGPQALAAFVLFVDSTYKHFLMEPQKIRF